MKDTWEIAKNLPKTDQPLLINVRNDTTLGGYYSFGYFRDKKFVDLHGNEVDCTHWMELPKPPVFRKISAKKQECALC